MYSRIPRFFEKTRIDPFKIKALIDFTNLLPSADLSVRSVQALLLFITK